MQKRILAALFVSLWAPVAGAITIESECENDTFVSVGRDTSVAEVALGNPGRAGDYISKGWFRIGPYKSFTVGNDWGWFQVKSEGVIVSSLNLDETRHFCTHPTDAFDEKVATDNRNVVFACLISLGNAEGERPDKMSWSPYQRNTSGTFTIRRNMCKTSPGVGYTRKSIGYKNRDNDWRYVHRVNGKKWVAFSSDDGDPAWLDEVSSTKDEVIVLGEGAPREGAKLKHQTHLTFSMGKPLERRGPGIQKELSNGYRWID